jgi:hypothetical protein
MTIKKRIRHRPDLREVEVPPNIPSFVFKNKRKF